MPKRGMEDEDSVKDSQKAKGTTQTSIPPLHSWVERINIRSRQDELDPSILEKLLAPFAIAAASIHKYSTSAFVKATDNTELLEMLKLPEMYTSQSHILNYELYKVLEMKFYELHSTVVVVEDIDWLRSKNKIIRSRLAVSEDARDEGRVQDNHGRNNSKNFYQSSEAS
ncbi:hypothetical protein Fot_37936 [Forsythia ovata]|uniref:Uncharacterized protein n=1 Tax=Forsythia ovata TaxID=205694 RepID=A0ABD1S0D3_9LAMI